MDKKIEKIEYGGIESPEGYMSPDSPDWLKLSPEEKKKRLHLLRMPSPGEAPAVDEDEDWRSPMPVQVTGKN